MKEEEGKTYLRGIPHEGSSFDVEYPSFKGTYGKVAEQIDKEGLMRPTSAKIASLVYDAFQNPKKQYQSEIIKTLKDDWLWEFTGNLYLPKSNEEINNGVILENNPSIINGKLNMDKNSLIKRLQENDSNVKFVPFEYKTEEQNHSELSKNLYIIARYGKKGAEKIAEVASSYKNMPYIWSFDSVDTEKARMSTLYDRGNFGGRLVVSGGSWDDDGRGHAFGVSVAD